MTRLRQNDNAPAESALDWASLASLLPHPAKVGIVEAMDRIGAPLSAAELERVFDGSFGLSILSYHLRALAAAGVVERAERRQTPSAWESHYLLIERVAPGGRAQAPISSMR